MPQLALAVVGSEVGGALLGEGVVAFGLTGSAIGFAAGSVVGSVLFAPTQKSQGSRLADLKADQVTYGSIIPYVEGHPRIGGIVIWASEKREISTTTSQGKGGGGESTTFTYEQDVLFLLAENVCPFLRRVWGNGELWWTPGDTGTAHWDELIFYSGDAGQLPDPTYEAVVGVGNAPAYRTRTTVMLRGLKLGSSGQLPVITFEVGPDATRTREGEVISLWNFAAQGPLALGAYPPGSPTTAESTKDDLSELSSPNLWVLIGVNHADSFIDGSGLFLQEYQVAASFSCSVFRSNVALPISGDFTIELRVNPSGHHYATSSGTYYLISATASGSVGLVSNGDYMLTKVFTASTHQLQFSFRDAGVNYTVTSGATGWNPVGINEVSVVREGTTLRMFMDGVQVGSITCGTGDIGGTALVDLGGRNGAAEESNDIVSGLWTGWRLTSGFARYSGTYATGQTWTLDGEVIDTASYGSEPTLQDVVERQCTRAGLDLSLVDASALATRNLHAMALTQLSSPRSVIEMGMTAYAFQSVESDKIYFTWRGQAPVATIPWANLVMPSSGPPLPITRGSDIELPVQVFVKYSNILDDYQDGNESSDRMISSGQNTSQVEFPLGLTPTEAKRIADFQVTDAAASNFRFGPFALDRSYSALEPGDVVNIVAQDESTTFTIRLTKKTEAAGILTFEGVSDDSTVLASVLHTDATGNTNSTTVRDAVDTVLALLDCPLLGDADDGAGFYADVKAATDVSFPGAALFKSDDDVTFASIGTSSVEGVFGTTQTVLGSGPLGVFDEGHVVTVDVAFGQLASSTRDALLAGATNLMLVGSEVIQFRDAALIAPGVYTLSGLLRGLLGTEWAIATHVAGEAVALLDSAVRHVSLSNADLGVEKFYKGVTIGRSTASADSQGFTNSGVSQKPRAPINVRRAISGGDAVITWDRRSRFVFIPLTGTILLGEAAEAYEIDVTPSGSGTTTYTSSTPSLTVTGGASSLTAGSTVAVYQMSAVVGRGYAGALTI